MIGATLSMAIVLWLASSYIEYKIIKSYPGLQKHFTGVKAIVISVIISLVVGFFLAPAAGAAVQLGALMGLASNEWTFNFYSNMEKLNQKRKDATARVQEMRAKQQSFKTAHPKVYNEAVQTLKGGFKTIGAIALFVVWLFGIPSRVYHYYKKTIDSVRSFKFSTLVHR